MNKSLHVILALLNFKAQFARNNSKFRKKVFYRSVLELLFTFFGEYVTNSSYEEKN